MPPVVQPPPSEPQPAESATPGATAVGAGPDRRAEQTPPHQAAPAPGPGTPGPGTPGPGTPGPGTPGPGTPGPGTPGPGTPGPGNPGPSLPRAKARRADPVHQQRSLAALFLALLSLFGVLGLSNFQRGVYIVAFALVAGAMAVWLAATAIRRARRGGTARPRGSVAAISIGGIGVLVSGVLLAGFALFGQQASTFTRCLSGANTVAAQQTCRAQFSRAIEKAAR